MHTHSKVEARVLFITSKKENRLRFEKAYIGRVIIPGTAYNIQSKFEMEGMFAIRVTPMGEMCGYLNKWTKDLLRT